MIELNVEKFNILQGNMTDIDMSIKLNISRTQLWRVKNKKTSVGQKFMASFMRTYPDEKIEDYFLANSVAFLEQNKVITQHRR